MNKILEQNQKIGGSAKRRVCLWNKKLCDAGFTPGAFITVNQSGKRITVELCDESTKGKRKVSAVTNHGNRLPVIDLKETSKISFDGWGDTADVVVTKGRIQITPGGAA